jgi:hypothetical protein
MRQLADLAEAVDRPGPNGVVNGIALRASCARAVGSGDSGAPPAISRLCGSWCTCGGDVAGCAAITVAVGVAGGPKCRCSTSRFR